MTDPTSELLAVLAEMEARATEDTRVTVHVFIPQWAARIRAALPIPEHEAFVAAATTFCIWRDGFLDALAETGDDYSAGLISAYRAYIEAQGKK
jgi:hypothetical protein